MNQSEEGEKRNAYFDTEPDNILDTIIINA